MSSSWAQIAEDRIREAIAQGEFDDLPGKGQPLDLTEYFRTPVADRIGHSILKGAGVVPPEVELLRDITVLETALQRCTEENRKAELRKELQALRLKYSLAMESRRKANRNDAALDLPLG